MPHLELDIEVEDAHVRGRLRSETGRDVAFVGWLSLLALLEQELGLAAAP